MKHMLKGFKEFALRGNVIDLAVAVVVGAAFAAVIGAFSDALIQPVIGIFMGGGVEVGTITIRDQVINFSVMINAVITFLITVAVIYFIFVVPMNRLRALSPTKDEEAEAEVAKEVALLEEIRDLLRDQSSRQE
jgi:large conductance mechanosensitive channel